MSIWYLAPSKRPPAEAMRVLHAWIERGYNVLVQRDPGDSISVANIQRPYAGYPEAVNFLIRDTIKHCADAEWFVTGGDDMMPDPTHAPADIASELTAHFGGTFGVMQPTGDRWGEHADAHEYTPRFGSRGCGVCGREKECDQHLFGAYVDRSASSPWIGREFARRMYGGHGPFCEKYYHSFDDTELQQVATELGVFWQRRDLIHHHAHAMRHGGAAPAFMKQAYSPENWRRSREIFERRKAERWPGHDPIP